MMINVSPAGLVRIDDIVVTKNVRRSLGEIEDLAKSISRFGLIHPVALNKFGHLIAGSRRIAAYKQLGRTEIPAVMLDLEDVLRGNYEENSARKALTPAEVAALLKVLEPDAKVKAKERMSEGGRRSGNLPTPDLGRARDVVAKASGRSRRTVDKIAAISEAAEKDPERFGPIFRKMEESDNVDAAYRELRAEQAPPTSPSFTLPVLPPGPFGAIVVHPSWEESLKTIASTQNELLPVLDALAPARVCEANASLWIWSTNSRVATAVALGEAWGFRFQTMISWVINDFDHAKMSGDQTRQCLVFTRGESTHHITGRETFLLAPGGASCDPPSTFFDLVDRHAKGRKLELFSDSGRPGWTWHPGVEEARNSSLAPAPKSSLAPSEGAAPTTGAIAAWSA